MIHKNKDQKTGCPYFNNRMQSCSLSSKGIYLPSRTDVLAFCMSPEYTKCSVYRHHRFSHGELGEEQTEESSSSTGKRRCPRLLERRSILLRAQAQQGDYVEIATTLDYSPEGLRVLTSREITMDTPFHFFFGNSFLVPGLQGVACPRWQRPSPDNPGFIEIGLAIRDEHSRTSLYSKLQALDPRS